MTVNQLNLPFAGNHGFWGKVTSTLDWCEENYIVSHHIAEFWNTLSNLLMMWYGIRGMMYVYQFKAPRRYMLTFGLCSMVGLGSLLFHGTLKFTTQMMDELPMVFGSSAFLFCQLTLFPRKSSNEGLIALLLLLYCSALTIVYLRIPNATLHQVGFGLLAATTSFLPLGHVKRARSFFGDELANKLQSQFVICVISFLTGFILWNIDTHACVWIRPLREHLGYPWRVIFELHGWWHFFTAYCAYAQAVTVLFMNLKVLGRTDIEFGQGWLGPVIKEHKTKIY